MVVFKKWFKFLCIVSLFSSFLFAFEYEVIQNSDKNNDFITIYLGEKEVYSLIGNDFETYKRAYSFISKLVLYENLNYRSSSLSFTKDEHLDRFLVSWSEKPLLYLSINEKRLNSKRGNRLENLVRFVDKLSGENEMIGDQVILQKRSKSIGRINSVNIVQLKSQGSSVFPAIHKSLPLGTKLRVLNLSTNWSIVVEVIRNEDIGNLRVLGINNEAKIALGGEKYSLKKIKIQAL